MFDSSRPHAAIEIHLLYQNSGESLGLRVMQPLVFHRVRQCIINGMEPMIVNRTEPRLYNGIKLPYYNLMYIFMPERCGRSLLIVCGCSAFTARAAHY